MLVTQNENFAWLRSLSELMAQIDELAAALEQPSRVTRPVSDPAIAFELRPSAQSMIPRLALGSGGQSLDWIARNTLGWATYHRPPQAQQGRYELWRLGASQSYRNSPVLDAA